MEAKYFNITELSKYINLKTKTIYDMVYQKRIPYTKVGGRLLRFEIERINEWLKASTFIPFDLQKCYNPKKVEGAGAHK
jgi:excisionase family DNA binding protein